MVMYGYGKIISVKERQVQITEFTIYYASISSTKEEEDLRVLLVVDEYTQHASNILKLSFISHVLDNPISRGNSGCFICV
jgi:ketopantoate hydroxymethyltransferase